MQMTGEALKIFQYHADPDFGVSASLLVSRLAQRDEGTHYTSHKCCRKNRHQTDAFGLVPLRN